MHTILTAFKIHKQYATNMQLKCRHVLPSSDKAREDRSLPPAPPETEQALILLSTLQLTTRELDTLTYILAEVESSSSSFHILV